MLYMVADSLGPEDISQRSRSRSNPEGCSFSTPRNPSCLPPPLRDGSKAKASPLVELRRNKPATRTRSSLCSQLSWLRVFGERQKPALYVFNDRICRFPFEARPSATGTRCLRSPVVAQHRQQMRAAFCANYGSCVLRARMQFASARK